MLSVADFIGRTYVPGIKGFLLTNHYHVVAASLARTLFVPIFLACNTVVLQDDASSRKAPLINSDLLYFLIIFAFGCSNG
jgi:equilibrative nucleoside transporter 1/2/3